MAPLPFDRVFTFNVSLNLSCCFLLCCRQHISGPSVEEEEVQEEDFDHHQKLNPQVEERAHRIEAM